MSAATKLVDPAVAQAAQSARLRQMVFPREHGAWGLLLVPLVVGAAGGALRAGRDATSLLAYTVAAIAIFLLRTPARTALGLALVHARASERRHVLLSAAGYAAIAIAAGALLLARVPLLPLLVLTAVAAISVAAEELLMLGGRPWHLWAHSAGAIGLTSTAAGAYFALTGRLDAIALTLWGFNFLFALNQLHFVHLRLQAVRAANVAEKLALGQNFVIVMATCALPMALAVWRGWAPPVMLLAFVPAGLARTLWFVSPPKPLRIHQVGLRELAHNLVFAGLLVAALAVV